MSDPPRPSPSGPSPSGLNGARLLLGATFAAFGVQLATLPRLKLFFKTAGYLGGERPGRGQMIRDALAALEPVDWVFLGAFGLFVLAAIVQDIRVRAIRGWIGDALAGDAAARRWALGLAFLWCVRAYLDPGAPEAYDAKLHMAKVDAVGDILGTGTYPAWTWRWYGGYPLLRFYGPIFYLLAGGLSAVGLGAAGGIKAALVLLHGGSAWVVHRLGSRWSTRVGFVAALLYLVTPPRAYSVLKLGRLPEAVLFLLFPLVLLAVEGAVAGRLRASLRWGVVAGAALAGMVLVHPLMGALGGAVAGAYALARLLASGAHRERPLAVAAFGASTAGLTLLLAAFWLLPAMNERPLVQLANMWSGPLEMLVPETLNLRSGASLLVWGDPLRERGNASYVSLGAVVLAVVGLRHLFATERGRAWPIVLGLGAALLFALGTYFHARCVMFGLPFLALAAAAAFDSGKLGRWGVPILLFAVIEVLPLWAVSPFRPDLATVTADQVGVSEAHPGRRFALATSRQGVADTSQWLTGADSGLESVAGPFREASAATYPWNMTTLGWIGDSLADGSALDADTVRAMRLLGIGGVFVDDGFHAIDVPVADGPHVSRTTGPAALLVDSHAPLLWAPHAVAVPDDLRATLGALPPIIDKPAEGAEREAWDAALRELLERSDVAADAQTAAELLLVETSLRDTDALRTLADATRVVSPPVVHSVSVDDLTVEIDVTTEAPGFLQLSYSWYPGVVVELNGEAVEPSVSVSGSPVISAPAGRHAIVLHGADGPIESAGWWFTAAGLAAAGALLLAGCRSQAEAT